MWAEHIKGWLREVQKEEADSAKTAATERTTTVLGGTRGEEKE